jgi:hypothetical protein
MVKPVRKDLFCSSGGRRVMQLTFNCWSKLHFLAVPRLHVEFYNFGNRTLFPAPFICILHASTFILPYALITYYYFIIMKPSKE